MPNARVEAYAPATVANLGVGFDILGMALNGMGDRAIVELTDAPGIVFSEIRGDGGLLPRDPEENVASVSARAFLDHIGETRGLRIELKKGLPLASGLGSSAASAVVTVVALNKLIGEPFKRDELLPYCLEGEALVSGYHADNVAPCLLGGIALVDGFTVQDIQPLPTPPQLHLALATPQIAIPTAQARAVMPRQVSLEILIHQTGKVARLIDALHRGDLRELARAMADDRVAEPARAVLMPQLDATRSAAKAAGALAVFIGGAGPTLCAICDDADTAETVACEMKQVYQARGIGCLARATTVDRQGAMARRIA